MVSSSTSLSKITEEDLITGPWHHWYTGITAFSTSSPLQNRPGQQHQGVNYPKTPGCQISRIHPIFHNTHHRVMTAATDRDGTHESSNHKCVWLQQQAKTDQLRHKGSFWTPWWTVININQTSTQKSAHLAHPVLSCSVRFSSMLVLVACHWLLLPNFWPYNFQHSGSLNLDSPFYHKQASLFDRTYGHAAHACCKYISFLSHNDKKK